MSNVVILSLVFPPDNVSTGQLMGDLACDLKSKGHNIRIITTLPHYNVQKTDLNENYFSKKLGRLIQVSDYYGIKAYHTFMPKKCNNSVKRILSWINFHLLSTLVGIFYIKKNDYIIVPSPPLTIGVSAWLIAKFHKSKFIYNIQELYPDYLADTGYLKNKTFLRFLYLIEYFVYKKAYAITAISSTMIKRLIKKGVPKKKLHLISNFVDTNFLSPRSKINKFSKKYNLHNSFIVSYAGNVGPAQNIMKLVDVALLCKLHKKIKFIIVGNGIEIKKINERISLLQLKNITILPYHSYEYVPYIYGSSDLSIVPLISDLSDNALPSKIYRIMACETAVLAFTKKGSDLDELIDCSQCGVNVDSGTAKDIAETIINLSSKKSEIKLMAKSGRKHVLQFYSRDIITEKYNHLLS